MNCPTCKIPLSISERQGIEIDYCQKCRGVWLDRGELDKLIERAGSGTDKQEHRNHERSDEGGSGRHDNDDTQFGNERGRRRENPIGEIFDFF